jgi:hypothetical protein
MIPAFFSGGNMLSRRELISAGAGLHMARGDAAAAQNDREVKELRQEVADIRNILTANPVATSTVRALRERQRQFFRVNQRFPECIDVGIGIWEQMQDWHIRNLRALNINRAGDGLWQMDFLMTVLVLKHALGENEISQA